MKAYDENRNPVELENEQTFLGECLGAAILQHPDSGFHSLGHRWLTVLVEDDENWFEKLTIDSAWLSDLIQQLTLARDYLRAKDCKVGDND